MDCLNPLVHYHLLAGLSFFYYRIREWDYYFVVVAAVGSLAIYLPLLYRPQPSPTHDIFLLLYARLYQKRVVITIAEVEILR